MKDPVGEEVAERGRRAEDLDRWKGIILILPHTKKWLVKITTDKIFPVQN